MKRPSLKRAVMVAPLLSESRQKARQKAIAATRESIAATVRGHLRKPAALGPALEAVSRVLGQLRADLEADELMPPAEVRNALARLARATSIKGGLRRAATLSPEALALLFEPSAAATPPTEEEALAALLAGVNPAALTGTPEKADALRTREQFEAMLRSSLFVHGAAVRAVRRLKAKPARKAKPAGKESRQNVDAHTRRAVAELARIWERLTPLPANWLGKSDAPGSHFLTFVRASLRAVLPGFDGTRAVREYQKRRRSGAPKSPRRGR